MDRKAAPATYTVHSTAPAYQEIKVLISASDVTTTTYVVHAFFQPVPGDCYAGTCNPFVGSCVCDADSTFQLQCPLSWKCALPRRERCATRHPAGAQVQRDVRGSRLQRAKLSPLSSAFFVLGENADLDSEWTCKCTCPRREPDVTGAPVQMIAPAWKSATKQRASANVTCNQESTAARKPL